MTGWWVVHLQAPLLISRRANADDFGHSYEANESKPCPARLNLGLGLTWAIHSKRSERIKSKERFWRHKHIDHYALSQFHLKSYLATIGRWISPNKEMSYPQEKTRTKQNTRIRLCHSFYFQESPIQQFFLRRNLTLLFTLMGSPAATSAKDFLSAMSKTSILVIY